MRKIVPFLWDLLVLVTFSAYESACLERFQLWQTEQTCVHCVKSDSSLREDYHSISVSPCTVHELSCCLEGSMAGLATDQKKILKCVYKVSRKIVHLETNIQFLVKSIEVGFIPKSFRVKNENGKGNQAKLNKVSFESMNDEKNKHKEHLKIYPSHL